MQPLNSIHNTYTNRTRPYTPRTSPIFTRRVGLVVRGAFATLFIVFILITSACGGTPQTQQQSSQPKTRLDALLLQAQRIGVPSSLLQPVQKQEQQLSSTSAPLTLFNNQAATDYYNNLATRYSQLEVQVQGLITANTQQEQSQAKQDMQNFQTALSQMRSQGLPVQNFAHQYSQDQTLLATAKYPRDYITLSKSATSGTQALNLLPQSAAQLSTLQKTITQMQSSHVDATAIQAQYQNDMHLLANATAPGNLQTLNALINAQYQQAVVNTLQALPYVASAKLNDFTAQISLLQTYGIDAAPYQQQLATARTEMNNAKSISSYEAFSNQINSDIAGIQNVYVQAEASYLIKQFHQEVNTWGQAHLFHDSYNGKNYVQDGGYTQPGIGSDLDRALAAASTPADYQNVVNEANNALFNLHMLEKDYADKTPYNQVHATDLQMLSHYKLQNAQVLMISLAGQAMRVYQNGKLVNAFQVTTGQDSLPSVPGVWPVMERLTNVTFTSPDPPSSPYWYPPTPINYAIEYHSGGYFVHDAWWRTIFGPGTEFPHVDNAISPSFADQGSHGCINMQEQQAAWIYNNTNWNTLIVIY